MPYQARPGQWFIICGKHLPWIRITEIIPCGLGHPDSRPDYEQADALVLDIVTVRNLELVAADFFRGLARAAIP